MLVQHVGYGEPRLAFKVGRDHRLVVHQRIARRRVELCSEGDVSHHARVPSYPRPEEEVVPVATELQHLDHLDIEPFGHEFAGPVQNLIEIVGAEGKEAETGERRALGPKAVHLGAGVVWHLRNINVGNRYRVSVASAGQRFQPFDVPFGSFSRA